jgi:hypothetical protein
MPQVVAGLRGAKWIAGPWRVLSGVISSRSAADQQSAQFLGFVRHEEMSYWKPSATVPVEPPR